VFLACNEARYHNDGKDAIISENMPKPATPDDLTWCIGCRKVIGPHKGWFGAECQCDKAAGNALRGAHGAGTRAGL